MNDNSETLVKTSKNEIFISTKICPGTSGNMPNKNWFTFKELNDCDKLLTALKKEGYYSTLASEN